MFNLEEVKDILETYGLRLLGENRSPNRVEPVLHLVVGDQSGRRLFASFQNAPSFSMDHRFEWQKHFYSYKDKLKSLSIPEPVELISKKEYSILLQEYINFDECKYSEELSMEDRVDVCLKAIKQLHQIPLPGKELASVNYAFPYQWRGMYPVDEKYIEAVEDFQMNIKSLLEPKVGSSVCIHGDINPNLLNLPTANNQRYCIDFAKTAVADSAIDYAVLLAYTQLQNERTRISQRRANEIEQAILTVPENSDSVLNWCLSIHASKLLTTQRYRIHLDKMHVHERSAIHIELIKKNAKRLGVPVDTAELEKLFLS